MLMSKKIWNVYILVTGGAWTRYMKEWTNFQKENPSYPFLNLCYEDMKKVINS
jgi:hypothetical protein